MENHPGSKSSKPMSKDETLILAREMDSIILAFTEISLRDCHDTTGTDGGSESDSGETDGPGHDSYSESEDDAERNGVIRTQVEDKKKEVEMTKREKWCAEQLDSISRDTNKLYGPESRQGISSAINDLASMSLEDLGNALGDALRRVFDGMRSSSVAVQIAVAMHIMYGILRQIQNPMNIPGVWRVFSQYLIDAYGPFLNEHGGLVNVLRETQEPNDGTEL